MLGFGVAYGIGREDELAVLTKPSLADALEVGYRAVAQLRLLVFLLLKHGDSPPHRHVDTAQMYKNESHVGEGIRESNLPRSEVFVSAYA